MKTAGKRRPDAAVRDAVLAAAVREFPDGVVISRRAGRAQPVVIFANETFLALTGWTADDVIGRPHAGLHFDGAEVRPLVAGVKKRSGGRRWSGDGYVLRKDGETLYVAWGFTEMPGRTTGERLLVGTYRDTTEKRRRQEALGHAQRLEAVGRLAGGIAHDFNNLLSVINGYCEILAAEVSDRAAALRGVSEIHRAGLRAATLTKQLLAFGRRTPMDPRVTNLNRIVQENAEILQRLIGTTGRLQLELAPALPNVRVDQAQLQQVLINLVVNSRDALRDNGCITIRTSVREIKAGFNRRTGDAPPGRYVAISVSDNGTGMDAETQKHLFEPFFTTKPEGKGTGLGLALVYGVVQQSNGFIDVHSALLAGSRFEILLPIVNAPEESSAEPPLVALPGNRGSEHLLLVEPDELVRKMVAGMLTAVGYQVTAARSVNEAVTTANVGALAVQLVICTRDGAGEALVKKLQASAAALRVLWICDDAGAQRVEGPPPERQALLEKPFALSELLRMTRALLDAE